MAVNTMGLGKGLEALIKETATTHAPKDIHTLPIHAIRANPKQPRRIFSEKALTELANSIAQQGVLQPILVRPLEDEATAQNQQMYEIVAGERRFRASQKAGLTEIPVVVRPYSDQESLTAALVENIQRESLNPMEEALALHALRELYDLSQEELALGLSKSRSTVANSMRLLSLPISIQENVAKGLLSAGHARALLSIDDAKSQSELHTRILAEQLTVRECEGIASLWKENGTFAIIPQTSPPAIQQDIAENIKAPHATAENTPENAGDVSQSHVGEMHKATPPQKLRSLSKLPQSAFLVTAQARFSQVLQHPVKISGKEDKGKITISYASAKELEALLQLIEPLTPQ